VVTTLSPPAAAFTPQRNDRNGVSVTVSGASVWSLDFAASGDAALTADTYAPALAFDSTIFDGLSVSADGRRCTTLTGRFAVLEVEYASNGSVARFAADLEQHCDDGTPALFAALRYNSTISTTVPFSGDYPRYELSLSRPLDGLVTGDNVACGGLQGDCTTTITSAAALTLTATPNPDSIFTGWTGACHGGTTTSVKINMPKSCGAQFDTPLPSAARTVLFLESTGDAIGGGRNQIYTPENAVFAARAVDGGNGVEVTIDSPGSAGWLDFNLLDGTQASWRLEFRAPLGAVLQPGSYGEVHRVTDRTGTNGGLDVSLYGESCFWIDGDFVVRDIVSDPATGALLTFSVDFQQHCPSVWAVRPLVGTLRFNSLDALRVRQVTLLQSGYPGDSIRFNRPVTWTAVAHPDLGVEYSFWRQDPSGGWTLVQPYSRSATYVWTPGLIPGSYSFQVWTRRIGSTEPYEAWSGTTVSLGEYPIVGTPAPSRPLPALVGLPITWSVSYFGGIEPVTFQFWRLDGDTWHMVQDYSGLKSYTWTPTLGDVGPHALQVWVRNAGSSAPYDVYRSVTFDVGVPDPLTVTSLTPNAPSPWPIGRTLTWSATATGGIAPLSYQFWRLDAGVWRMVQDYGPSATYSWTPGGPDIGQHALQVWVRSFGSNQPYDAWASTAFSVAAPNPATLTSLSRFPSSTPPAGMEVQWTVMATGGLPPLQYQFWRLDVGTWTMVRDWGPSNTYTWRTGLADIGAHALQVWVRSAGSAVPYESWLGESFTIGPPVIEINYFSYYPSLHVGTAITWTAVAFGGVAPLQYQFWRLDADGWHLVQDYGPSQMYTWTPTVADIGPHAIQVWIRNGGSTAPYDVWRGMEFVIVP